DCIERLHQSRTVNVVPFEKSIWPILDQISNFTDGNDTVYARTEFIKLLVKVWPERVPDCYAHHIGQDEGRLADDALEAYSKLMDFRNAVDRGLAGTFLDRCEVLTLAELRDNDDIGAGDA